MNIFDGVPNEMRGMVKKESEKDPSILNLKIKRYSICLECEELNQTFKICKQCSCLMPLKTLWKPAECPLKKW